MLKFKLDKRLASGSDGIAYSATNLKNRKEICLKISKNDLKDTKRNFQKEIRVYQLVGKHSRILNMIGHGKGLEQGRRISWIETDYCKNGDLWDML